MVVGQREVDHLANLDDVLAHVVGNNDRPFDHSTGTQDGYLRLVNDWSVKECTARTRIGNGERAATEFIGGELVGK